MPQKVSFEDTRFEEEQTIPEREKEVKFGDEVNEIYREHVRKKDKIRE